MRKVLLLEYRSYTSEEAVAKLTEKERTIFTMRTDNEMTLEAIGKELGLTGSRVSAIEKEICKKLFFFDKKLEEAEKEDPEDIVLFEDYSSWSRWRLGRSYIRRKKNWPLPDEPVKSDKWRLSDFEGLSKEELTRVRGIGEKQLDRILSELKKYGYIFNETEKLKRVALTEIDNLERQYEFEKRKTSIEENYPIGETFLLPVVVTSLSTDGNMIRVVTEDDGQVIYVHPEALRPQKGGRKRRSTHIYQRPAPRGGSTAPDQPGWPRSIRRRNPRQQTKAPSRMRSAGS